MNYVNISVTHNDEVLCQHRCSFLTGEKQIPSHPLHRLLVIWNSQQGSGVDRVPVMLAPLSNTPPPTKYIYI